MGSKEVCAGNASVNVKKFAVERFLLHSQASLHRENTKCTTY